MWEHRPPAEVHASRVLIVGHGSIGQAAAERLEALGAHVTGIGRSGELRVAEADVIVNLVPLTEREPRMFDAAVFAAMRDGALFVNAGRGGTVDQEALLAEVTPPRLRAVLDVPTPSRCRQITRCGRRPVCWRSRSHHAGDSLEADARTVQLVVEQLPPTRPASRCATSSTRGDPQITT